MSNCTLEPSGEMSFSRGSSGMLLSGRPITVPSRLADVIELVGHDQRRRAGRLRTTKDGLPGIWRAEMARHGATGEIIAAADRAADHDSMVLPR